MGSEKHEQQVKNNRPQCKSRFQHSAVNWPYCINLAGRQPVCLTSLDVLLFQRSFQGLCAFAALQLSNTPPDASGTRAFAVITCFSKPEKCKAGGPHTSHTLVVMPLATKITSCAAAG